MTRLRKLLHTKFGYTLTEVMIAAIILAIGVGGMMLMISQSLASLRMSRQWTYPLNLARDAMEKISRLHGSPFPGGGYYTEQIIKDRIDAFLLDYDKIIHNTTWHVKYTCDMGSPGGASLRVEVNVFEDDETTSKASLQTYIEDWP